LSVADVKPRFFKSPDDFRAWMEKHHANSTKAGHELLVGFYKRDSGKPSITWPESVDVALCFGWIDGVRRRIDDTSYTIRFTPRKPTSTWSAVNVKRVAELERLGLMTPGGRAAFEKLQPNRSVIYSYEQKQESKLDPTDEQRFRANKKAWEFLQGLTKSRRQLGIHRVVSAKKPETRQRRLEELIRRSEQGIRPDQL
jgi:uncharacterized protein YdeI (YjbR/CyaY-like superfamily)